MKFRFWSHKSAIVLDHFRSNYAKKALVSTVHRPFVKQANFKHNNQIEALEMAQVVHELGYRVDVVNFSNAMAIDYSRYDLLFGSGPAFEGAFLQEAGLRPKTILYQGGAFVPVGNRASLRRLQDVFQRRGVWLPGSGRIAAGGIVGCEEVVDGLIVLGNAVTGDTYRAVTDRPVHQLPLLFIQVADAGDILQARDLARVKNHFMWFAGAGLVHKGLDLVLEAFARHPELHLHVYGAIDHEPGFSRAFHHELRELPNVHVERWLALESPEFREALLANAFVICPSAAEGCCSSVLNVCGNGAIVPILTRECGIDLEDYGVLVGATTVAAVEAALLQAAAFSEQELDRRMRRTADYMGAEHSRERYHQRMKAAVQAILEPISLG
jgi:glycosyltransferase involved in cell wall biosynthesis